MLSPERVNGRVGNQPRAEMADTLSAVNLVEEGLPYRETADFQSLSLISPLPCSGDYHLVAVRQRQWPRSLGFSTRQFLTRYRHLSESFPPFYRLAEIGLEKKSNSPYFTHVAPMRGMCGCSSVG
jgi:hypothetical protein